MQFDIKYAYFNFLQSLHFRSATNPTSNGKISEDSED